MKNYTRANLERFLEKGDRLGFRNEKQDSNYLGWIILWKDKVDYRYLDLLADGEELHFRKRQKEIEEKPYVIQVCELERSKYEDESFEEELDRNDIYRFTDLDAVQTFLDRYDKQLKNIKWLIEIDAP